MSQVKNKLNQLDQEIINPNYNIDDSR